MTDDGPRCESHSPTTALLPDLPLAEQLRAVAGCLPCHEPTVIHIDPRTPVAMLLNQCADALDGLHAKSRELASRLAAAQVAASDERAEMDQLNGRLYHLLTGVAIALKGPPSPGKLHDLSDLPRLTRRVVVECRTLLEAESPT